MTLKEFEKVFEKKRKKQKIKEIALDWKIQRNTLSYFREKAKMFPLELLPEWIAQKIK